MNDTRAELIRSIRFLANAEAGGIAADRFTRTRSFLFCVFNKNPVSACDVSSGVREQTLDRIEELDDVDLVELHWYIVSDFSRSR